MKLVYNGLVRAKKNSKQIAVDHSGRPFIMSNKDVQAMERDMVEQFQLQMPPEMLGMNQTERILKAKKEGKTYEVMVTIFNPNKIRRDLDNQLTSVLDGLVRAGALPDDCASLLTSIHAKFGGVDRQYPRAEIEIKEST